MTTKEQLTGLMWAESVLDVEIKSRKTAFKGIKKTQSDKDNDNRYEKALEAVKYAIEKLNKHGLPF